MVKEEEIMAEAGGGRSYMDLLGLGEDDYLLCLSPSSYFTSSIASATTTSATTSTTAAASLPTTCTSYLDLAPAYHHMLSFAGQEQYQGDGVLGFQCYGGDHAIPAAVPQKSSPTTECSSSISSMSSSPPATAISAVSCSKPQAFKKKGSRSSEQRKAASAAATAAAAGGATNKRPRVRRERLGERIIALQQLVSPFGKSDTASVLHEALGYIRFLHDQVQVLSSPNMQRQPASAHVPVSTKRQTPTQTQNLLPSAAGTVVEPPRASDLRSRSLCLVPVSCTEHLAGNSHGGNGADLWSVAKAAADNKGPAGGMLLPGGGHPRHGRLA
ncbi:transcription factor bHLH68-like isoform X2 [Miscanthus floridulus]|uniref:transcription factor bHLH68-like isoform X2 n=1 Tax=Miscanthus floridulus TaxID=154761 RepID=UPI003458F883